MISTATRPVKSTAFATSCDFSGFAIGADLKRELELIASFGCDKIWYGEIEKTRTSGYIDGHRWLFAVLGREWFFIVFRRGDEETVRWENSKKLSLEESWDISRDLEPELSPYLRHPQVFRCLLKGIEEFRAAKPFD